MPPIVLLVGTRKGCFVLESDGDRRDWNIRGPFCEGWPIYHAVHDPVSGSIYAAAASEWHGAGVWRSNDLGESWELSSEGLGYGDDGLRLSKISGLTARTGACSPAPRRPASSRAATAVRPGRCSARSTASPAARTGTIRPSSRPATSGCPAILPHPDEPSRFWVVIQGFGIFETTDDGALVDAAQPRAPRRLAARGSRDRLLRAQARDVARRRDRMYQQNHFGMHRSDDGGHSWTEITEGLPTEFGFAAAAHPHDRESFYVIPLDPGHGRCMPEGRAAVWRTSDAGSTWQRLDRGLPQRDAHLGVLREGMAIDSLDVPGLYFGTSTGQVFASADEGESWDEIASYLPAISSVEVAVLA